MKSAPRMQQFECRQFPASGSLAIFALAVLAALMAYLPLPWLAVGLVSATLATGILVRPALGLIALAALIPFGQLLPVPALGISAVDIIVILTLASWLAWAMASRGVILPRTGLGLALAVFLWVAALSLTRAASWRLGLPEWLKWAEFAAVYFLAAQVLRPRQTWYVVAALLLAGIAQVGIGAYQFWRQAGPDAFVLMGRFMRAYGTFRQPNPYAGYLGYLAPVAAALSLYRLGDWFASRRWHSLVLGLTLGLVAIALLAGIGMSWSRGAWLGSGAALVTVALFSLFRSKQAKAIVLPVLLIACLLGSALGAGWVLDGLRQPLASFSGYLSAPDPARTEITDENFSVLERLAHWQAGSRMFEDHPWQGVGIGNYAAAYAYYAPPHWYEALGHAHNAYINFLAETGVLGLATFLALWLAAFRVAWLATRAQNGPRAALGVGLVGLLVFVSVHNLFDNLFVQHMQLQLALVLGALGPGAAPRPVTHAVHSPALLTST